jgi:hypothetical protein
MEIIYIIMALLLLGFLIFAAIVVNRPKWIKVNYIVWSRTKKWVFAIVCGFSPWVLFGFSPWLLVGAANTLGIVFMLERQKHFISIKFHC